VSLARLQAAWRRSDSLFGLLAEEAWLEQPIALRQPFLFYLGHLPAVAWNHVGRGLIGRRGSHQDFDALFERRGRSAKPSSTTATTCARSSATRCPTPPSRPTTPPWWQWSSSTS
jgi:hypothetical protein